MSLKLKGYCEAVCGRLSKGLCHNTVCSQSEVGRGGGGGGVVSIQLQRQLYPFRRKSVSAFHIWEGSWRTEMDKERNFGM